MLADCQPGIVPTKQHEEKPTSIPVAARRGRSRAVKTTRTRLNSAKQTAEKQPAAAEKQPAAAKKQDHIAAGLVDCAGLQPVLARRELLKRRICRAPVWTDMDEYHNLPFHHQLHDMTRDDPRGVTFPQHWTIASLTKIDNVLYIGQRRADSQVLFKRELPFSLKSVGGESCTSCLDEMKRIIRGNDESVLLTKDKVEFWKSRFELNSSLGQVSRQHF